MWLSEVKLCIYSLSERSDNKTLLNKSTHLNNDDFLIRMLYKDSLLLLLVCFFTVKDSLTDFIIIILFAHKIQICFTHDSTRAGQTRLLSSYSQSFTIVLFLCFLTYRITYRTRPHRRTRLSLCRSRSINCQ